jgi:D-alanyl-D-alanine-carboxypeptidase/D-alanyl-D-alanine-endopeptidase
VGLGGFGGAGPRTIFQVGSVTKVFTALLLADMTERGEVRPTDPAARYLPGGQDAAGPVTLADLATHTSGLPRLPRGLFWPALLSPRDPYARYPASWFRRAARRALRTAPGGSPYLYSNFGYGVLGYLLGRAAGSAYEDLVATRVCAPLGLTDTTFAVPGPSRDRKAQGHQGARPVPDWRMGALAAAGALYSTSADLGTLLRACLAGGETGLAWHLTQRGDRRISWHNGMTGGFSAMIAFDPDRGRGVAALANSARRPPSPLDQAVLRAVSS